jgi:hypothetical protein
MGTRCIFAGFDTRRPRGRQPQTDRPTQKSRFELSIEETSLRGFETKPKLEDADPFGELATASLVLTRVESPIVEGPKPPLPIVAWRDHHPCLGRIARTR